MSAIIDDLVKKLKQAKRDAEQAQRAHDEVHAEGRHLLTALEQSRFRVDELESAISILRNNLKPGGRERPSDDKVTALRPK